MEELNRRSQQKQQAWGSAGGAKRAFSLLEARSLKAHETKFCLCKHSDSLESSVAKLSTVLRFHSVQ